jgi:flavin reductase (DIM6/NTAB) family NADH-FMN oxidoreductase RutF
MFYRTSEPHGLPHNPFNALVVPRPIGWISTVDRDGRANLAPYSFFNGIAYHPPQVMFSGTAKHPAGDGLKDSIQNAIDTGEFVVNFATYALREQMNLSCANAPSGVDEFEIAGLTKEPAELVRAPRVKECPAHLECKVSQTVVLETNEPVGSPARMIIGRVEGVHIDESVLTDGLVDFEKLHPLARLGYMEYADFTQTFTMHRPDWPIE